MSTPRKPRLVAALVLALGSALGSALGLAPLTPVDAATTVVSVQDFSFTPATVTVGMGQSVTWSFHSMHTTTSNQRFWDSGMLASGSYAVTFRDAGTFGYHCTMHPSMTGRVRVPVRRTGAAADGWRVRWSVRASTPTSRRFDVQYKRSGATSWKWFRNDTVKRSGFFNPARSGSYLLRARTRNVGVGVSGWSPRLTLRIT